jgi:hypothetical protein
MGRARCLSDVAFGLTAICGYRSAKLDPRAPRRRSRSQSCIFVLDQGRLWASGTIRQLPDEDAIPPSAGCGCRTATEKPPPEAFIRVECRSTGGAASHNVDLATNIRSRQLLES